MTLPFVSVLTPTFGRAPDYLFLLQECIQSVLNQNYEGRVEHLILNDTPGQILWCSASNVRILNWHERISSLGLKRNKLCEIARGDLFCVLDDDDLVRPGHVKTCVEHLLAGNFDYFNPQRSYWLNGERLHSDHNHGVCHNASAFTRYAWLEVGGYPDESVTEDASMDRRLKSLGRTARPLGNDPADWTHIYRWGKQWSDYHISGGGNPQRDWQKRGEQFFASGVWEVVPDYTDKTRRILGKLLGV